MTTVADKLKLLKNLNLQKLVKVQLSKDAQYLADLQTEQMSEGYNAEGKRIGRYRNKEYAALKNSMNSRPGNGFVDLKLTGSFYEAVTVDIGSEVIEYDSTDSKTEDLKDKYGEEIFGLNENSQSEYREHLQDALITEVEKILEL